MTAPMVVRAARLAPVAGAALLALPGAAWGATATFDRACYVSGQPGTVALAGFSPNAVITLTNAQLGRTQQTTDVTGSVTVTVTPPDGSDFKRPRSAAFTVTATEDANPANTAIARSRIAPLAFATDGTTKSPKARRSWYFSGWTPGKAIYGHFRFGGRTRGNYRFGVARGACGEYRRRAPGIAVRGRVRPGTWTVQIDHARSYRATTRPALATKTVVFNRFRRQNATSAAALSTAALTGWYRFRAF